MLKIYTDEELKAIDDNKLKIKGGYSWGYSAIPIILLNYYYYYLTYII